MIEHSEAMPFLKRLEAGSVSLYCFDPPYYATVGEKWDRQWKNQSEYLEWLREHVYMMWLRANNTASLLIFAGISTPKSDGLHVADRLRPVIASAGWHYRNWITWRKRRAYGKANDYLFCREEILWFSADTKKWAFNIPYLAEERGYDGWNKKYPAKSKFKRVSNVWTDIPELMRPRRNTEKPAPLLERLVSTHSNEGDLVIDPFAGLNATGRAAAKLRRRFMGCDSDEKAVTMANEIEE